MTSAAEPSSPKQFKILLLKLMADHPGPLAKGFPLIVGFLIYFIYFCQTSFFPSIDLYSLILLLISAFLIGSAVLTTITLGYFFPGWSWVDTIFRKQNGIWASHSICTETSEVDARKFMFLWLARPLMLHSVCTALAWAFIEEFWIALALSVALPIVVVVFFSIRIRRLPGMNLDLALDYIPTTLFTLGLTTIICMLASVALQKSFDYYDGHLSAPVTLAAWAVCSLVILANAVTSRQSFAVAFVISITFSLGAILAMRGAVVLPSAFVAILGVGHYEADQVVLKNDTCAALVRSVKNDQCIVPKAWVTWAYGDTYKIRVLKADSAKAVASRVCKSPSKDCKDLVLQKSAIVAIIRNS